jgi:hypothetical protein
MNDNTTTTARHALDRWLTMWNGSSAIAREICADDFRIRFSATETDGSTPGDDVRSAEDFVTYLDGWHAQHPGFVFTNVGDAIDGDHGRMLWDVRAGDVVHGGVDVFDFDEDGRVSRVWSVGGQRTLRS